MYPKCTVFRITWKISGNVFLLGRTTSISEHFAISEKYDNVGAAFMHDLIKSPRFIQHIIKKSCFTTFYEHKFIFIKYYTSSNLFQFLSVFEIRVFFHLKYTNASCRTFSILSFANILAGII